LLLNVIPADNVLFASETFGAVRATDPNTGCEFDDTKSYIEASNVLSDADKAKIYTQNALGVYKRLGFRMSN
jgi:4-oxalmesaconate hydratase